MATVAVLIALALSVFGLFIWMRMREQSGQHITAGNSYDMRDSYRTISYKGKTYRYNDLALLDESMLEFAAEGKVYPMMNRMAVRYNDPAVVADRVCGKYQNEALAASVRAKIMQGDYFVPFDLQFQ